MVGWQLALSETLVVSKCRLYIGSRCLWCFFLRRIQLGLKVKKRVEAVSRAGGVCIKQHVLMRRAWRYCCVNVHDDGDY